MPAIAFIVIIFDLIVFSRSLRTLCGSVHLCQLLGEFRIPVYILRHQQNRLLRLVLSGSRQPRLLARVRLRRLPRQEHDQEEQAEAVLRIQLFQSGAPETTPGVLPAAGLFPESKWKHWQPW